MSIFDSLNIAVLGGKYKEAERISLMRLPKFECGIDNAVVRTRNLIRREDGEAFQKTAICCLLKSGSYAELPLSTESSLHDGDVVDADSIVCIALTREGDGRPVFRFDGKPA